MAFTSPAQGQVIRHTHVTQLINALTGVSGAGEQIALTQYSNSSNYAADIRNLDTTNGYGLRVRDASSNNLILAYKNNVALGASSSDTVTINGLLAVGSNLTVADDILLGIGTGNTARFSYDTTDANANELLLQLPAGGATDVPVLVIGQSIESVDLGLYNGVVNPRIAIFGVGAVATGPVIEFRKARGTVASPTVLTTGDDLGTLDFYGAVAAGEYVRAASIRADMAGTIATTRGPGTLTFLTATDAAPSVLTAALTLNADQSAILAANVYINETANANMTFGLTINQGAADNEALALKSSDVTHLMTAVAEADTYLSIIKGTATGGAPVIQAFSTGSDGIYLDGCFTTDTAVRSTAAVAPLQFRARKRSTDNVGAQAADSNLAGFYDNTTCRALVDSDGDLHLDAVSNNNVWDAHDDLALLESYRILTAKPLNYKRMFAKDIEEHAKVLNDTGVVTLNEDGHHFVSLKGLFGLVIDGMRQLGAGQKTDRTLLEERIALLEQKVAALPAA